MTALMMTESELQSAVLELAHLQGWMVTHFRPARLKDDRWVTPLSGDPGFPDLCLARGGLVRFFEVKREKGKLTVDQERWRRALGASTSEDDQWKLLVGGVVRIPGTDWPTDHYGIIRPSRWLNGQVAEALQ